MGIKIGIQKTSIFVDASIFFKGINPGIEKASIFVDGSNSFWLKCTFSHMRAQFLASVDEELERLRANWMEIQVIQQELDALTHSLNEIS